MELGEEDVMLSFDVVSLFTRVPVDEDQRRLYQQLRKRLAEYKTLPK